MHFPRLSRAEGAFVLALLLAPLPAAAMLDCKHIRVDDVSFNLEALGGPHSVVTSQWHPPTYTNTSYTVDICAPLKRKGDVKKEEQCPSFTRVCAIERNIHPGDDKKDEVEKVIPIAGELGDHGGSKLDATAERLKSSDSNSDAKKEGVRLILNGGSYPLGKNGRNQKAIIEFLCDRDRTGLEGEVKPEDQYDGSQFRAREEGKEGEDDGPSPDEKQVLLNGTALIWNSYGPNEKNDMDVLRLTWHTKYACEDAYDKPPAEGGSGGGDTSSHWGFFTWLFVLAFLGIAAYLIFGSWLNYNRYGARGWDLLPHGDTIRDIPYLVKDWTRNVLNTVNTSGGRGGYSAV
ncbi:type II membrane protein [Colletotrichum fioriniae]|uniref:type II membrane protein n=1 Tax=Colletotrichum fioriniae TaxID=710243 RepID=UPI0032D9F9F4|nr:type II membrane protein [Colletotrichum fioriniae]